MTRLEELLEKLQNHEDVDGAIEASKALEEEAVPEWLPTLHEWLAEPEEFFLRECTAPAVIRLEGMASLPRLLHAMRLGRDEGMDNDTLQTYITDLVESQPESARDRLQQLAVSAEADDRSDAAWLLGYIHEHTAPTTLISLSADSSAPVREAACGSLASYKDSEEVYAALTTCLSDAEEDVRISAVSALGYYGDRRALPLLGSLERTASDHMRHLLEYSLKLLHEAQ